MSVLGYANLSPWQIFHGAVADQAVESDDDLGNCIAMGHQCRTDGHEASGRNSTGFLHRKILKKSSFGFKATRQRHPPQFQSGRMIKPLSRVFNGGPAVTNTAAS